MKKNIWIINDYAGSPYHGEEIRHFSLAKNLIDLGYNVCIITASYSHLFNKVPKIHNHYTFENIEGVKYLWVKVPKYKNSESKLRILKWLVFSIKLFFIPVKKLFYPDLIVASPTAPFFVLSAYYLSKKFKSKFIYEVKDIWPKTLIDIGGYSKKNPFIILMSYIEKFAINKADKIVSNLSNYGDHLLELGSNKNFEWISNGINISNKNIYEQISINLKNKVSKNKFSVGYVGSFGESNSIDTLVNSIILINNTKYYKDIEFVFVGDGKLLKWMKSKLSSYNNIIFINRVSKEEAIQLMKCMNLLYKGNPNKEIYSFGISPIKLYEYMYCAVPIVHSTNVQYDIVEKANCGITVPADDANLLSEAIINMSHMSKEKLSEIGLNGKNYVIDNFTYGKLAEKYDRLLKKIFLH